MLAKLYAFTPVAMALIAATVVSWAGTDGSRSAHAVMGTGDGRQLPSNDRVLRSLGWWGSATLLIANGALFASLYFGVVFLAVVAPGWPVQDLAATEGSGSITLAAGAGLAALASIALIAAGWVDRVRKAGRLAVGGWVMLAACALLVAGAVGHWQAMGGHPQDHALYALQAIMLAYVLVHFVICGLIFIAIRRSAKEGAVTAPGITVWRQWLVYTGICGLLVAVPLGMERLS